MPLRFVGAMGALAPIFKGLSLFQVAILACIGFSINLGNFVWELGTDYFVEHAAQITVQAPDQNVTHYAAITNGALESLTLQYYLNERRRNGHLRSFFCGAAACRPGNAVFLH